MGLDKTVDTYIEKHETWQSGLTLLRKLAKSHNLEETIKWGAPVYTLEGKNILGLGAFKSYVGIWFFQGGLLKDEANKLMNAQEGKTQAMRQWRFESTEEIQQDSETINSYIREAITNQKAGKKIKAKVGKPLVIPTELQSALNESTKLKEAFEALNLSKKREFAEYIQLAKRDETKSKRLEKITPMILEGIGLNDKYK
ncbi:DUF1801 domain-containing protein [uncultured Roseivirga sp.]|uniref:YdeI/OmpD-associated family protein n=1 Tax=uncultured Roseivirga sp. TaxID=543088 RepID=UPI000D7936AF|nr:DUF1801 domain-containing protein [uncultured Roseivirga sp.]PWL31826.1 MAG: hypothetical protein DCO95_01160 [Roseivirga sp. XM-24bin3]